MDQFQRTLGYGIAALAMAVAVACGGGNGSPIGPSGNGGAPGPSGATITIANGGVSPSEVTISVGQSVTFVNNDGRSHQIVSDPHPTHGNCPSINAVGTLQTGQTRLTNAFTAAATCGFHDHDNPDNTALQGRIIIR